MRQGAKPGLEYPVSYLAKDPEFVSRMYEGWERDEVAKRLVPGGVKAYADTEEEHGYGHGHGLKAFRRRRWKEEW